MTTLPYRRQQVTPRSGGRVAGDRRNTAYQDFGRRSSAEGDVEYATNGNAALAPRRARPEPGGGSGAAGRSATRATAARATQPRLRVAPPPPVSAPRAPFVTLVLAVVIAGVFGILALNTAINTNAFKLKDLRDRQTALDRQEQQLTGDVAMQESPNNLAAAARQQGLVPAGTPAFIVLPDGRVLGVPVPASGQQSASGAPVGSGQPRE